MNSAVRCLATLLVLIAGASFVPVADAATIWERTKSRVRTQERKTLRAVERVLVGEGGEVDQFRARTALVSLSRGELGDLRLMIALSRLRRELQLEPPKGLETRLRAELQRADVAPLFLAWGHLEVAHFAKKRGDSQEALRQIRQGLRSAWFPQLRAELLLFRGFVTLRFPVGRRSEFREVLALPSSQRQRTQALVGQALRAAWRGDRTGVERSARAASHAQQARSTVSGVDLFGDLSLTPSVRRAAEAVLAFADSNAPDDPSNDAKARDRFCELLQPESGELLRILDAQFKERCERRDVKTP